MIHYNDVKGNVGMSSNVVPLQRLVDLDQLDVNFFLINNVL